MNRPDAVVDFLESDGVLLQRVGDEEQTLLEPKRARGNGDGSDVSLPFRCCAWSASQELAPRTPPMHLASTRSASHFGMVA